MIVIRGWREEHPVSPFRAVLTWSTPDGPPTPAGRTVKSIPELSDAVRTIAGRLSGADPQAC